MCIVDQNMSDSDLSDLDWELDGLKRNFKKTFKVCNNLTKRLPHWDYDLFDESIQKLKDADVETRLNN